MPAAAAVPYPRIVIESPSGRLGADIPDGRGRTGLDRVGRDLDRNPDVRVDDVEVVSDGWHVLRRTTLSYRRRDGVWERQQRETYDRGNGATILLYDLERRTVLLTRQFRYPAYVNDHPDGMLLETAAGLLDGDAPEEAVRRELAEELGAVVGEVRHVFDLYMSPGSVTERVHFFVAPWTARDVTGPGGGVVDEGEDIEAVELPFDEALRMVADGRIVDGKTVILLQWAALQLFPPVDSRKVPGPSIRSARMPEDSAELTRVWREAVEATHDFLSAEDVDFYAAQVAGTYLPAMSVEVATAADGEVLGFAGVDGDRLEMLFVGDRARGTGVGTALLEHVRRGRERLAVDVNEQNPSAYAFYLRRGFRRVGRSETDADGRPFPILHLEWTSGAGSAPTEAPVLQTERLRIAPLAVAHAEQFASYRRVPEVARWQSWDVDYSVDDALRYLTTMTRAGLPDRGEWQQLGITDSHGLLLGDVAVHRLADQPDTFEVGVTLAPHAQGRGVATEALGAVVDELFTAGNAHRVLAFCDARNEPVARLLARLGFRRESRQVDGDWFKGEWTTLDGWALLARDRAARN